MTDTSDAPAQAENTTARVSSRSGRIVYYLALLVGSIVFFEGAMRVAWYFREGRNPYYLSFGFTPALNPMAGFNKEGYFTFPENRTLHLLDKQNQKLPVHINANGFRGLTDFATPKPAGVYRIAALGGSSVFGFFVKDDETWPARLQQILNDRLEAPRIEVLNLGIPTARSPSLLALATHEFPALEPDLLVLYEGCNDARSRSAAHEANMVYRIKNWFLFHSVAYNVAHPVLKGLYHSFAGATNLDPAAMPHLALRVFMNRQHIESLREAAAKEWEANVVGLLDVCSRENCDVLLVTQSYSLHNTEGSGLEDAWRTYAEEVALVEREYEANDGLLAPQVVMLIHRDLMDILRRLAAERGVPLLEGIAALDADRSQMLTYVHMSAKGNAMLAEAIAGAILEGGLIPSPDSASP